jgi:hypothetical protein
MTATGLRTSWQECSSTSGNSQAVTGRALRADDDELLHLAVPVLAALGRDKAALTGVPNVVGAEA